jgi:hypothetical protein
VSMKHENIKFCMLLIISWFLLLDDLSKLLECFVYIYFLSWYLLTHVLLFSDSTNTTLLPYKHEICCCLLINACALVAYQNTDFCC